MLVWPRLSGLRIPLPNPASPSSFPKYQVCIMIWMYCMPNPASSPFSLSQVSRLPTHSKALKLRLVSTSQRKSTDMVKRVETGLRDTGSLISQQCTYDMSVRMKEKQRREQVWYNFEPDSRKDSGGISSWQSKFKGGSDLGYRLTWC